MGMHTVGTRYGITARSARPGIFLMEQGQQRSQGSYSEASAAAHSSFYRALQQTLNKQATLLLEHFSYLIGDNPDGGVPSITAAGE